MGAKAKYPLRAMKVGEEILVKDRKWLVDIISKRGMQLGRYFKTRRVGDQRRVKRIA